jgi:hypothetical protein
MQISIGVIFSLFVVNVLALTEQDVIRQVLNNHTLFQSSEIDMFSEQERLKSKYKDYYGWDADVLIKYSVETLTVEKDGNYSYTNNQLKRKRDLSLNLSTAFESGASFKVKFSRKMPIDRYDKYKNLTYSSSARLLEYDNVLEASINIPLLKDSDGGNNQLYYNKAKLDKEIEKLNLLEDKEDEVAEALDAFIEIALNLDKLKTYQNYLLLLSKLSQTVTNKKHRKLVLSTTKKTTIAMNKVQATLDSSVLQLQSSIKFRQPDLLKVKGLN